MPARSSAATTRPNCATLATGPMRTRYILRPAIRSSRTKILPKLPPRNFSARRCAFAGSENAAACTNNAAVTAAVLEGVGAAVPGTADVGCAAVIDATVAGATVADATVDGAKVDGTAALEPAFGVAPAGGTIDAEVTGVGTDGSMA